MKSWFPFTDYDFYAYLSSGALAIAVWDYELRAAALLSQTNWTFVQGLIFVAAAYAVGHLVASLSGGILEYGLARRLLTAPASIQLGVRSPNFAERFVSRLVGRYYDPFSEPVRSRIWAKAGEALGCDRSVLDAESVFQCAFKKARSDTDTRARIDAFRNLYGFCRNLAFVALLAAVLAGARLAIGVGNDDSLYIVWGGVVLAGLMIVRFMKFYCAFAAETLRALV